MNCLWDNKHRLHRKENHDLAIPQVFVYLLVGVVVVPVVVVVAAAVAVAVAVIWSSTFQSCTF